jgi:3D (Asp-Asp-Asp) domain-containing protein
MFYESQTTTARPWTCYGPRLVRRHQRTTAARFAAAFTGAFLVALLVGVVPAAVGADSAALRGQADGLRSQSSSLEARANAATLELYALETELGRARSELAALQRRRHELAHEHASARAQLVVARRALRSSQSQLAKLVRSLYEQPGSDPLAILLGARSLEEALAALEGLDRASLQSNRILEQAREARGRLATADAKLAARRAALARTIAAAEGRTASLAAAVSARKGFIAGLRRRAGLNAARIAAIEAAAGAAERRGASLTRTAAAATATSAEAPAETTARALAPSVAATGERTVTVTATGYALEGRTATGIPTGPGVVAVDPTLIPLGTQMTIPGYGSGIAADTGGAVHGATVDLWFPTMADALAWGRRTVTITLH